MRGWGGVWWGGVRGPSLGVSSSSHRTNEYTYNARETIDLKRSNSLSFMTSLIQRT